METKGKRAPRGPGETDMAAEFPVPPEAPSAVSAPSDAPAAAAAPGGQPPGTGAAPDDAARFRQEAFAAFAESRAAMTRGMTAISEEMAGLGRTGIDLSARLAAAMLAARSIADVCALGALGARETSASLREATTRLSGLGVELAAESARPILLQLGRSWVEAVRLVL